MNINEQYESYRNKTSDELMETLLRLTAEQKQTGEMTEGKMEEARMREIIARLNTPN